MKMVPAHVIAFSPSPQLTNISHFSARTFIRCLPFLLFSVTEFQELMVIAFQGPSVFTLRRSGTMLWCVAGLSFQSTSMNLIK